MRDREFSTVSDALEVLAREADRLVTRAAPGMPPISNNQVQEHSRAILEIATWLFLHAVDRPKPEGY